MKGTGSNFEEQEPSIAYYSGMENIRSEGRMIYSTKDKNRTLQNSTENIIKASYEFYSDLIKAGVTDKQLQDKIFRHTHTHRKDYYGKAKFM